MTSYVDSFTAFVARCDKCKFESETYDFESDAIYRAKRHDDMRHGGQR